MAEPLGFLSATLAFAVIAASPGPANLAAASVAMATGRTKGMRFALGLALTGLKIMGGVYLLWLGLQSLGAAGVSLLRSSVPQ